MERTLRGSQYLIPEMEQWAQRLVTELPYLDLPEALQWYNDEVGPLRDAFEAAKNKENFDAAEIQAAWLPYQSANALLGCNDRFYLLNTLLGRDDLVHHWLFDRCREVEADPDGHIDLWARYHGKTSVITVGGIIQEIVCDPNITIAVFSATKPLAKEILGSIKEEFENNEFLKAVYDKVLYQHPRGKDPITGERPAKWSLERGITVRRTQRPKEATIEAHGLLDGQPTGRHFHMHVYDDVVTQDYLTEEQLKKTTARFEMADNLGTRLGVRKWIVGTRYCTVGSMRILMADWTHKPIAEVKLGDEIVGWELRDGKRWLRRAKVIDCGLHRKQPVNRYSFSNGRSVTCTSDHKWWRGASGSSPEYNRLALPAQRGGLKHIQQLLVPTKESDTRSAAWLAGFFDGEGTVWKNTHHPSGQICITQTTANSELIEETRRVLRSLRFEFRESWIKPSDKLGCEKWSDRCVFYINGGWRERYRFLIEVAPVKREKLAQTLFAQLMTERLKLESVEPAGEEDVYWLETRTGNYVIEGFCSSNSFADTYGVIIERGSAKPRIYPATVDGTLNGELVLLTPENWDRIKRDQGMKTVNAQMLLNPTAGNEATFKAIWLKGYDVVPRVMNVAIMVDPSKGSGDRSDRTAIAVIGVDPANNKYLLDGVCHRMKLTERLRYVEDFKNYWENFPGVQQVKVGWERYGASVELEVVEERLRERDNLFPIAELNTPRQGGHSKNDRIERLEPDLRGGRFYIPAVVYHPEFYPKTKAELLARGASEFAGFCYWSVWTDQDAERARQQKQQATYHTGQIIFRPVRGLTRAQRDHALQSKHRIVKPLKRWDENKDIYDLTRVFMDEMVRHPFAVHDDFIDAVSRIYDIDLKPPMLIEARSTESIEADDTGIDPAAAQHDGEDF